MPIPPMIKLGFVTHRQINALHVLLLETVSLECPMGEYRVPYQGLSYLQQLLCITLGRGDWPASSLEGFHDDKVEKNNTSHTAHLA